MKEQTQQIGDPRGNFISRDRWQNIDQGQVFQGIIGLLNQLETPYLAVSTVERQLAKKSISPTQIDGDLSDIKAAIRARSETDSPLPLEFGMLRRRNGGWREVWKLRIVEWPAAGYKPLMDKEQMQQEELQALEGLLTVTPQTVSAVRAALEQKRNYSITEALFSRLTHDLAEVLPTREPPLQLLQNPVNRHGRGVVPTLSIRPQNHRY